MKQYQADYRQGKRRSDGPRVSERTRRARAVAEEKRKALWFLQNKEWCADRQRERRRSAAAHAAAALLGTVSGAPVAEGISDASATGGRDRGTTAKKSKRRNKAV